MQIRLAMDAAGRAIEIRSDHDLRRVLDTEGAVVWIDIDRDNLDELRRYDDLITLHPLAVEDAESIKQRPIFQQYGDTWFLVIQELFATEAEGHGLRTAPISFFVGKNYVITARDIERSTLDDVEKRWKLHAGDMRKHGSVFLLFTILDAVVDDYFPRLEELGEILEDLHDQIEEDGGAQLQRRIHRARKAVFDVRRALAPEREVLNELIRRDNPLMDDDILGYFHDVYDHLLRVLDWLDAYREMASTLFEMQIAMASFNLDKVMRTLTVASIILMACALIAGIYGMNFHHMPELAWFYGYPMAIGLMLLVSIGLLAWFRWRDWI